MRTARFVWPAVALLVIALAIRREVEVHHSALAFSATNDNVTGGRRIVLKGCFCPPHKIHVEMVKDFHRQGFNEILIYIDAEEHNGYAPEVNRQIWNIYKQALPDGKASVKESIKEIKLWSGFPPDHDTIQVMEENIQKFTEIPNVTEAFTEALNQFDLKYHEFAYVPGIIPRGRRESPFWYTLVYTQYQKSSPYYGQLTHVMGEKAFNWHDQLKGFQSKSLATNGEWSYLAPFYALGVNPKTGKDYAVEDPIICNKANGSFFGHITAVKKSGFFDVWLDWYNRSLNLSDVNPMDLSPLPQAGDRVIYLIESDNPLARSRLVWAEVLEPFAPSGLWLKLLAYNNYPKGKVFAKFTQRSGRDSDPEESHFDSIMTPVFKVPLGLDPNSFSVLDPQIRKFLPDELFPEKLMTELMSEFLQADEHGLGSEFLQALPPRLVLIQALLLTKKQT